jgi:hypothetical protein
MYYKYLVYLAAMDKIININFKKSDFLKLKKIANSREMSLRSYCRLMLIEKVQIWDAEKAAEKESA